MKLTELFKMGEFVVTSEVGPVKGCCRPGPGAEDPAFLQEAESIRDYVHAVNVTDNQSARMRLGSLAAAVLLKRRGIEPIYQLTCRDRNRLALQSDLLSACSLGIDNVLCLTGDHLRKGDHPTAKAVFDLDSVQLLKIARNLNEGCDMMGQPLTQPTGMALGALVNPNFQPLDLQLLKMEKKIAQGARFFQTQTVYDPKVFETFINKAASFGVPIQYGIVIIKSPQMARYMNEKISGVSVPLSIIDEMAATPPELYRPKAREITARLLGEIAPMVQGIHFMPMGWSDLIPQLVDPVPGFCRCGAG
jgi:methylenetetrahydrofolate reductase (NADPH)